MLVKLILILTILFPRSQGNYAPLISTYFKNMNIDTITIMSCWNITTKMNVFSELTKQGFVVSFSMKTLNDYPTFRSGAFLDLSCEEMVLNNILDHVTKERLLGPHTEWLLLDAEDADYAEISRIKLIEKSYILPGSRVTLAKSLYNVKFYDVYKTGAGQKLKINILGSWNESLKLSRADRSNFEGLTLPSGTVVEGPEELKGLEDYYTPELDVFAKVHYPLILNLAEQLNFKFTLFIEDTYGWMQNGNFSGLMHYFQTEEVEFAACSFLMREDRRSVLEFTTDTFELRNGIIFKKPSLSTVSNIFVLPFSRLVWVCCGVTCMLTILFLSFEALSSKYFQNLYPFTRPASFADVATSILGFVCQQGSEFLPVSYPARITTFVFSLAAIFLYTSYSANILGLLQSSSPSINSLSMLSESRLSLKMQDRDYNPLFFKEVKDNDVQILHEKKVRPQGNKAYCSPAEGMAYVRTGTHAFGVEMVQAYKIISDTYDEDEKCDLTELRLFFMPRLSIPVLKKSGYREIFTQKLAWQREAGMFNRMARIFIPPRPSCKSKRGGYKPVGFIDFLPAILSLLYGTLIALALFILELIYAKLTCVKVFSKILPIK